MAAAALHRCLKLLLFVRHVLLLLQSTPIRAISVKDRQASRNNKADGSATRCESPPLLHQLSPLANGTCPATLSHLGRQHGDHVGQWGAGTDLASGIPLLHDAHLDAQHTLPPKARERRQTSSKAASTGSAAGSGSKGISSPCSQHYPINTIFSNLIITRAAWEQNSYSFETC